MGKGDQKIDHKKMMIYSSFLNGPIPQENILGGWEERSKRNWSLKNVYKISFLKIVQFSKKIGGRRGSKENCHKKLFIETELQHRVN